MCLEGTDKMDEEEEGSKKSINSTHSYDKEISLSNQDKREMQEKSGQPVVELLDSMGMEKRLKDIILYALGMINSNQTQKENGIKSIEFFKRISKYLRSIGYYGDAPFMMCNYGSSEYSQAFSRVGSLFGNVYIVNEEMHI